MKYTQEQLRKMLVSIYECASAWDNDDGKMAEANEKTPEDILAELLEETTKVKSEGKDELYCEFWRCLTCSNSNIPEGSKYCSECGRKITSPPLKI